MEASWSFVELRGSFLEASWKLRGASWSFVGDFGVQNVAKLNFSEICSRNAIFSGILNGTASLMGRALETEHLEPFLSYGAFGLSARDSGFSKRFSRCLPAICHTPPKLV